MKKRGLAIMTISVAFAAILCLPQLALATVDDETDTATAEETAAALAGGVEGMPAVSSTSTQNSAAGALTAQSLTASSTSSYKISAVSGANRYETAVKEAELAFTSTNTVIIASGDKWADSLAATALAGAEKCPILLTATDELSDETKQALTDLGVKNIIIVGGDAAISNDVQTALEAYDSDHSVVRLSGDDRYATQMAIYDYGVTNKLWGSTVIITTGENFADALSVSPIAYAKKAPIFLVDSTGSLETTQEVAIAKGGFTQALVLGGDGIVSSDTDTFLAGAVYSTSAHSSTVTRLSGDDRYETSAKIASWAVENAGFSWNNTALATGNSAPDALAGAALQGKQSSPILLVADDDTTAIDLLKSAVDDDKATITSIRVLGGLSAVSGTVRTGLALTMGWSLTSIEGFKLYLDAGHGQNNTGNGYYDSGAVGCGYQESKLNAELVDKIAAILKANGMDVFVNDDGGPYKLRQAEAVQQGCMAIVSIHFNCDTGKGYGTEILRYTAPYSELLEDRIYPFLIAGTNLFSRGEKYQEVTILRGPLPATLCEVAFIDYQSDMDTYQARKDIVAQQIANGIMSGN